MQFGNVAAISGNTAPLPSDAKQRWPMFHDTRHSRVNNRYREQIQRVSVYAFLLLTRRRAFRKNDLWRVARAGAVHVESISKHGPRFSGERFENACRETSGRAEFSSDGFQMGPFRRFPKLRRPTAQNTQREWTVKSIEFFPLDRVLSFNLPLFYMDL